MNPGMIAILSIFCLVAIIYFGSRLQMKGWIHEFDRHFKEHYKHIIKSKADEEGKKI